MALLGLMRGRKIVTKLLADSKLSLKICVVICPLLELLGTLSLVSTAALCSLASASGTTLNKPADSTMVKPCIRKLVRNWAMATWGLTAFSLTSVIWPLTRGSTTTLTPAITPIVRATSSMSVALKFKVMKSPRLGAAALAGTAFCVTALAGASFCAAALVAAAFCAKAQLGSHSSVHSSTPMGPGNARILEYVVTVMQFNPV